jgi:hypothetical protein
MSTTIRIEEAQGQLVKILMDTPGGESVTVVDASGVPMGVVVSLRFGARRAARGPREWTRRWDALTARVNAAWKSENSAVQLLSEMRR